MFKETEVLRAVDSLLETYRSSAIMLHRPYPPHLYTSSRSKVGGLPNLPETIPWPMGRESETAEQSPMHFLAQVDCAELPRINSLMPDKGILFFFASNGGDQCWEDGEPKDSVRVIYVEEIPAGQPKRSPPPNLQPILDRTPKNLYASQAWRLPEESAPSIHVSWPLIPLRIESWPDLSSIYETRLMQDAKASFSNPRELDDVYERRVNALRVSSVLAATGLPTCIDRSHNWGRTIWTSNGAGFVLPDGLSKGSGPFPECGIMIDRVSRFLLNKALYLLAQHSYQTPEQQGPLKKAADTCRYWIERTREIGLEAQPDDQDREAFRRWLCEIGDGSVPSLKGDLPEVFSNALLSIIEFSVDSPMVAESIAPDIYDSLANRHLPIKQERRTPRGGFTSWLLSTHFHQMLGYPRSCQDAQPVGEGPIMLLQMDSDYATDMKFGDAGSVSFWINPKDLKKRRFENVWVDIAGF